MIKSNAFDYINLLDKAADAAWKRNEVIANNIANAETPGYKRQDLNFEGELKKALGQSRYNRSVDAKVGSLKLKRLNPRTYTDYTAYSYRVDKNNVDPDTEGVILASNQLKYQALVDSFNQEFANLKTVTT